MNKKFLFILGVGALLGGCTMMPQYDRPVVGGRFVAERFNERQPDEHRLSQY